MQPEDSSRVIDFPVSLWKWIPEPLLKRFPILAKWRRALARDHANEGKKMLEQKAMGAAIQHYVKAVQLEPNDIGYLNALGRIWYEQKELEKAGSCFQKVLSIDFHDAEALKGLGFTFHFQGKLDDAVYCYLRFIQVRPDDASVHANLISALEALGKYEDAIAAGKRASIIFPKNATFPFFIARNKYDAGEIEAALEPLARAAELDPSNSEIQRLRGNIYALLKETEKSLQSFRKAVELDSGNAAAYLDMAQLLNKEDEDVAYLAAAKKAREIYQAKGDLIGMKYAYWDEGWAYYRLGRMEECVHASEQALAIDSSMSSVQFNLGLALLHTGKTQKAKEAYQKAMNLQAIGSLKKDGIDDLEAALEKNPDLPGAKEILGDLNAAYDAAKSKLGSKMAPKQDN